MNVMRVLNITAWHLNCTPAAESQDVPVVSIAAPSAGVLVLLLLVAATVVAVGYIWR